MTVEEYFGDWCKVIDVKEAERLLKQLSASKTLLCPELKNVFRAFELCTLKNLRVVVLTQDPYNNLRNGKPVAQGLAFANAEDTREEDYSPSLKVLRESVIDFTKPHGRITFDPTLENWEEQGVLMLNSALTCALGKPGSHSLMWRHFTKSFLLNLSKYTVGIVYVLLGSDAQSFEDCIAKSNFIIKDKHPAYYARNQTRMPSSIWKEINDILINQNGYGIEWYKEYNY